MNAKLIPSALVLFCLTACGEPKSTSPETIQPPPSPGGAAMPTDHGAPTDLGTVNVGGREFGIVRLGDVIPGEESAFYVHPKGIPAADLATLNIYLWIESRAGTQLSAAVRGSAEGGALHFHVMPQKRKRPPFRVVLRVRDEDSDERASLPLDGHGHEHASDQHHGVTFKGGDITGYMELEMHSDQGNLELRLARDPNLTRPFELPRDTSIEVEFVDLGGRKVTLRPRDHTENLGQDAKTNFFMFPSTDGDDNSWLKGKDLQSIVIVRFTRDGQAFVSEEFVVKSHSH